MIKSKALISIATIHCQTRKFNFGVVQFLHFRVDLVLRFFEKEKEREIRYLRVIVFCYDINAFFYCFFFFA